MKKDDNDNLINKTDYSFFIMWRDTLGIAFKVGILACINDTYYLRAYPPKRNNVNLSEYNGLPSFSEDKLYISYNDIFDFFKRRIPPCNNSDYYTNLKNSSGIRPIDSFYLEETKDEFRTKLHDTILKYSLNQEKREQIVLDSK